MSRLCRAIFAATIALLTIFIATTQVSAHPARMASGIATIHPDGRIDISLSFDLPAFVLNDTPARVSDAQMYALLDGPGDVLERKVASARTRFARALRVFVGDSELPARIVEFPEASQIVSASKVRGATRLPVVITSQLGVQLPAGTTQVRFGVTDVIDSLVLTIERDDQEPIALPVQAGELSPAVPVKLESLPAASAGAPPATTAEPSKWTIAVDYVVLGFEHIVPKGLDHILFVLGLFLLSPKLKPLLTQVTCFTVAHSITLGLAMFGVIHAPARIVEPVIALSIAFVAVENLWTSKLKPWRPAVIFLFGLVHGLGFAGVLADLGLPRSAFVPALISFNVGVELGQLAVIGAAFLVVGWASNRQWYRNAIVRPVSVGIAAVGLFWTVQRVIA